MAINKKSNDYVDAFDRKAFADTPKTVWAAIAISFAAMLGHGDTLPDFIRAEWQALYDNGIVPQKPTW